MVISLVDRVFYSTSRHLSVLSLRILVSIYGFRQVLKTVTSTRLDSEMGEAFGVF